ncbi:unnamed protein product [Miscanthus lutarioriparius]|uniref:Legume lectin domain-containing protein n=1 Tax=Miscanthus lutarioriparius TaxID=422564 RepID=A0A811PXW6_9POAL|nr:unnamed protein product [Miscanthus lutarioriparius]
MTTGPWRRGGRATTTTSLALLLLLACVAVCSIPAVLAQATTSTSTVAGRDFTTFSFPGFDKNPANLTLSSNASVSQNALQITPDTGNNATSFLLAPNDSSSSGDYMVWIDYNGTTRHVWVYMSADNIKPDTAVLNVSLDLSKYLLSNKGYFGFSASTGVDYQLNCVLMWNMTVEVLHGESVPKKLSGWKLGLAIGVPCAAALAFGLLAGLYLMKKKRKKQVGDDPSSVVFHNAIDLRSIPGVPKEFDYKELRKGTNSFDDKMKLGQGGQLLEWVWKLHGAGRVLEAVDPRLAGGYDEEEAERLLLLGLACSHPNPRQRPKAQAILQNLQTRSVPPLPVPMSKPVFMWPVPLAGGEEDETQTYMSHSGVTSSDVTSSSNYPYTWSSGYTTQTFQVSREAHDAAGRDVSTI